MAEARTSASRSHGKDGGRSRLVPARGYASPKILADELSLLATQRLVPGLWICILDPDRPTAILKFDLNLSLRRRLVNWGSDRALLVAGVEP